MPDSVRMIDLAGISRGLESFRRLDPEQRVLTHKVAAGAAAQRIEEAHKDVREVEDSPEAQIRERSEDHEDEGQKDRAPDERQSAHSEPDPPPEMDEGHILNIRV